MAEGPCPAGEGQQESLTKTELKGGRANTTGYFPGGKTGGFDLGEKQAGGRNIPCLDIGKYDSCEK